MSKFTAEEFNDYLQETLIPDLEVSGHDAMAEDFETAAAFVVELIETRRELAEAERELKTYRSFTNEQ